MPATSRGLFRPALPLPILCRIVSCTIKSWPGHDEAAAAAAARAPRRASRRTPRGVDRRRRRAIIMLARWLLELLRLINRFAPEAGPPSEEKRPVFVLRRGWIDRFRVRQRLVGLLGVVEEWNA